MGAESLSRRKSGRGLALTTHSIERRGQRNSRAIHLLPLWAFLAGSRVKFNLRGQCRIDRGRQTIFSPYYQLVGRWHPGRQRKAWVWSRNIWEGQNTQRMRRRRRRRRLRRGRIRIRRRIRNVSTTLRNSSCCFSFLCLFPGFSGEINSPLLWMTVFLPCVGHPCRFKTRTLSFSPLFALYSALTFTA